MNMDLSNYRGKNGSSTTYLVHEKETMANMYILYFQLMPAKKYNSKCNRKINLTPQKGNKTRVDVCTKYCENHNSTSTT